MMIRGRWYVVLGLTICIVVTAVYFLLPAYPQTPVESVLPPQAATPLPSQVTPPEAAVSLPQSQPRAGPAPTYRYTAQGQVAAIIYPDGSIYTYLYDAQGDKIREITTTGKTWSYVYDQNHHPFSVIDPEGRVTRETPLPEHKHNSP